MKILNEGIKMLKVKNKITNEIIFSIIGDEVDLRKPYTVEVGYDESMELDFDYDKKRVTRKESTS